MAGLLGSLAKNHGLSWSILSHLRARFLGIWGIGKKQPTFEVHDFVSMVDQFMDRLGIVRAPLVGHSMGGSVSLSVTIQYPERVSKVVVIGSPIVGSSLALLLKLAGYNWIAALVFHTMWALRFGLRVSWTHHFERPSLF